MVNVNSKYHGSGKISKEWYLEPDSSITDSSGGHGVELVSPALLLDKSMIELDKICKWMTEKEMLTNDSTGLHINVSVPGITEKLDPVKLVLFMGEDFAKDIFGRAGNPYAKSQIDVVLARVKADGILPPTVDEMISAVKKALTNDKHHSVNLGKLSMGYLEFRVAGGTDYHKDADKIKKTVYRFITAVEVACDPNAERQEYLKKLTKLFGRAGDELQDVTRADIDELPQELHRLYKYNPEIMKAWKLFDKGLSMGGRAISGRTELLNLIKVALKTASNFKTHLDLNERVFFKKKIKEAALQSADVDRVYSSDPAARHEFKKQIGI
jgi:hypothetical protein